MSKNEEIDNIFISTEYLQNLVYNKELELLHLLNSFTLSDVINLSNDNRYKFLLFHRMVKERVAFAKNLIDFVYKYQDNYSFEYLDRCVVHDLLLTLQSTTSKLKTIDRRYKEVYSSSGICLDIVPSTDSLILECNVIISETQNWNLLVERIHNCMNKNVN